MGTTQQRRRQQKQQRRNRRQQRQAGSQPGWGAPVDDPFGHICGPDCADWARPDPAELVVGQAVTALLERHPNAELLVRRACAAPGALPVLRGILDRVWISVQSAGWTLPLVAHAGRKLGVAEWVTGGGPADPRAAFAVLDWLVRLPSMAGRPAEDLDPATTRMLDRVRALLAKAEATEYPEEAEALTAKAQQLISRHALAQALADGTGTDRPGAVHVLIDSPYVDAKAQLLAVVAGANRCRSVQLGELAICTVLGYATDLRATEIVYTSLLVQATHAMTAAGSAGRRARQPGYRRSFYLAYAIRIGERLRSTDAAAVDELNDEQHDDTLLPVLAARTAAVDEVVDELFPELVNTRVRASDHHGWAAGTAAADLADLAAFEQVASG